MKIDYEGSKRTRRGTRLPCKGRSNQVNMEKCNRIIATSNWDEMERH